jgi:hypothetical protein
MDVTRISQINRLRDPVALSDPSGDPALLMAENL